MSNNHFPNSNKPLAGKPDKKVGLGKNKRLTVILMGTVIGMFGFSYLMVPIFNIICKQTGIDGKAASSPTEVSSDMKVDYSRTIKVQFSTTIHGALNFKFSPVDNSIAIHPGEHKLIYFYAENQTGDAKTVQAVPSITPADAARFLRKIECFCFTQQYFYKGEKAKMPVNFYIDPAVPTSVKEMTLSYTLFDATGFEKKNQPHTSGRIEL